MKKSAKKLPLLNFLLLVAVIVIAGISYFFFKQKEPVALLGQDPLIAELGVASPSAACLRQVVWQINVRENPAVVSLITTTKNDLQHRFDLEAFQNTQQWTRRWQPLADYQASIQKYIRNYERKFLTTAQRQALQTFKTATENSYTALQTGWNTKAVTYSGQFAAIAGHFGTVIPADIPNKKWATANVDLAAATTALNAAVIQATTTANQACANVTAVRTKQQIDVIIKALTRAISVARYQYSRVDVQQLITSWIKPNKDGSKSELITLRNAYRVEVTKLIYAYRDSINAAKVPWLQARPTSSTPDTVPEFTVTE